MIIPLWHLFKLSLSTLSVENGSRKSKVVRVGWIRIYVSSFKKRFVAVCWT